MSEKYSLLIIVEDIGQYRAGRARPKVFTLKLSIEKNEFMIKDDEISHILQKFRTVNQVLRVEIQNKESATSLDW